MSTSDTQQDPMYRVIIDESKENSIEVQCIGMYCVDSQVTGFYSGLEKLPQWMQEKVALLMMTSYTPPTTPIEGIGQRIGANKFWVQQ
mgnify:FL=1|jgi:hypothetical protein